MHAHLPRNGGNLGPRALEYTYRIYLGHGITTVRDAGTGAGIREMAEQRRLSAANQIVAPRLVLCQRWPLPLGRWNRGDTPEKARAMVREFKALGADCVKVSKSPDHYPDVLWRRKSGGWAPWPTAGRGKPLASGAGPVPVEGHFLASSRNRWASWGPAPASSCLKNTKAFRQGWSRIRLTHSASWESS